jgi:prepilin-type N-terminal cleavage/methylation domain-containing protein
MNRAPVTENSGLKTEDGYSPLSVLPSPSSVRGFTLLEMLVSLAIGALIIGAVMGVISESLRYRMNLKEKANVQPILESAAQMVLADPARALEGVVRLTEIEGSPVVGVYMVPVPLDDQMLGDGKSGRLFRVVLSYQSAVLELSLIISNNDLK